MLVNIYHSFKIVPEGFVVEMLRFHFSLELESDLEPWEDELELEPHETYLCLELIPPLEWILLLMNNNMQNTAVA